MSESAESTRQTESIWEAQFDPQLIEFARSRTDQDVSLHQDVALALLAGSARAYRRGSSRRTETAWKTVIGLPVFTGAAYGVVWVARLASRVVLPGWTDWVLFAVSGAAVVAAFMIRRSTRDSRIDIAGRPKWDRFRLGRIEFPFDQQRLRRTASLAALLLGFQAGLVDLTVSHAGLSGVETSKDAWLATIDNVMHGILLDAGELYGLRFGPELEHSTLSATVFLVFRIALDILVGISVYHWYRGHELQKFIRDFPRDAIDANSVCRWIEDVVRAPENWVARFGLECVFLQMLRAYLAGRFDDVAELNHIMPALRMTARVRSLFVDSFGFSLLPVDGTTPE
jgi:hypothetical protein